MACDNESIQTYHFGNASPGDILKHSFYIHNKSAKVVRYSKPKLSCGCVSVIDNLETIDPGETKQVTIALDTTARFGFISQYAIYKIDGEQKILKLSFEGTVKSLWLDREILDFGCIQEDTSNTTLSKGAFVLCSGLDKAKITTINNNNANLAVEIEKTTVNSSTKAKGIRSLGYINVTIKDKEHLKFGKELGYIDIITNDGGTKSLKLKYSYYYVGKLFASPANIMFGTMSVGDRKQTAVRLKGGDSYAPLYTVTNDKAVTISVRKYNSEYEIVASYYHDGSSSGYKTGEIRVTNKEGVILSIPYIAFLKEKER